MWLWFFYIGQFFHLFFFTHSFIHFSYILHIHSCVCLFSSLANFTIFNRVFFPILALPYIIIIFYYYAINSAIVIGNTIRKLSWNLTVLAISFSLLFVCLLSMCVCVFDQKWNKQNNTPRSQTKLRMMMMNNDGSLKKIPKYEKIIKNTHTQQQQRIYHGQLCLLLLLWKYKSYISCVHQLNIIII